MTLGDSKNYHVFYRGFGISDSDSLKGLNFALVPIGLISNIEFTD